MKKLKQFISSQNANNPIEFLPNSLAFEELLQATLILVTLTLAITAGAAPILP